MCVNNIFLDFLKKHSIGIFVLFSVIVIDYI